MAVEWHDEAARFEATGELDPVDRCLCPECRNEKHVNCTGDALDDATDTIVACQCECP